ncbi:MAG: phosphoribosylanthranilate isomerase [Candidatus Sulfotelmatobacter sp.]
MTWVKICGMTNLEDALVAVEAGADAVGFVFYEKSPRCVTVETAREIVEKLPERIDKVGVFVNELPEKVSKVADEAGLTVVQFHGDEYQNPISYSVNRDAFFCVPAAEAVRRWREGNVFFSFSSLPNLAGVLLDSGTKEERGGTGKTFAWGEAYSFVSALGSLHHVVVAGGLNAANVGWAVDFLKPWGVDVVSGVEASPGKKDPEKVRAFVRAVRECDRKTG